MSIQLLLQDKIDRIMSENPELKNSGKNKFEVAVAHILNLKFFTGLDIEDLLEGVIGKGGDEGIDICYLFINDYITKEFDETTINKASSIRLELVQAKRKKGFSTNAFDRFCQGILEIFTLDEQTFEVIGTNDELRKKAELIKEIFRDTQKKGAKFDLRIHYATIGDTKKIAPKIKYYKDKLSQDLNWAFKEIDYNFWGAQELNEIAFKKDELLTLEFTDSPLDLSEKDSSIKGFAGFVRGETFIKALIDEKDQRFRDELTEGNVRFFMGIDTIINSAIIETALGEKSDNFWAMNNGITIIGDRISPVAKNIKMIENPQIVNGCQTVNCLHEAYKQNNSKLSSNLKVFIKLVETKDEDIQQDIISSTNSQNEVARASLKANDKIQKNIEESLSKYNIYYERRKNFYKMKGKTGLSVFSLEKMAQIMHTIFRKEAIRAVNHTKDLFLKDDLYSKIFHDSADLDTYLFATKIYQKIWSLKNSDLRANPYDPETKELKSKSLFCLLHICSSLLFNSSNEIDIAQPEKHNEFTKIKKSLLEKIEKGSEMENVYKKASDILLNCANSYGSNTGKVKNTLFKNRTFDKDYIKPEIEKVLQQNKNGSTTITNC